MSLAAAARHPVVATVIGFVALASAMGIGRFAFTPMLPLMQAQLGVSLQQGSWLASANYAGYFVGALALSAVELAPHRLTRFGLVAVAMLTLAMGWTESFFAWLLLRFLAGIASACVLIGVSGWALTILARAGRERWSAFVFAGVGTGIVIAGLIGLVAGVGGAAPAQAWLVLGSCATLAAAVSWPAVSAIEAAATVSAIPGRAVPGALVLTLCYGAFGFGYILPATFLPALARQAITDPAVFGWVWPVFGAVAIVSALAAGRLLERYSPLAVWAASHVVMAAGVIAPAVFAGGAALLVCAVAVGGTFVVVTLAGIQHARVVAGRQAPRLVAAMTAAFALGQLVGPLTLGWSSGARESVLWPSVAAAVLLLVSAAALVATRGAKPA